MRRQLRIASGKLATMVQQLAESALVMDILGRTGMSHHSGVRPHLGTIQISDKPAEAHNERLRPKADIHHANP